METFGECLRPPCRVRGVMRGRWMERSEPSVSLLRIIEVGHTGPSVPVTELVGRLFDTSTEDGLNLVGIGQGEPHLDGLVRESKQTVNRKISSPKTALSIFGTSQMRDQHELEFDCILAWSLSVFIHQRSDSWSDLSRTVWSDKGRISTDRGPSARENLVRGGPHCDELPEHL